MRTDSILGVPGLMEAARAGNVAVANALGRACTRALCTPEVIEQALTRCYYQDGDSSEAILEPLAETEDLARGPGEAQTEDLMDVANRAPIVKLVNTIFYQAFASRASAPVAATFISSLIVRARTSSAPRKMNGNPSTLLT